MADDLIKKLQQGKKNRETALKMRRAGKKWREIGDHFNVSYQRAQTMVKTAERDEERE